MRKTFRFWFIATILVAACNSSSDRNSNEIQHIQLDLQNVQQERRLSQIFSEVHLVKLETNPNSFIGEVNKVFITDDKIAISDGRSLYQFNFNGEFVSRINNLGKGPGEYTEISDFVINQNGVIEILNADYQRVIRYSNTGNFIDSYKINRYALNMAIGENNTTLFHCGNSGISDDASGKIIEFSKGDYKKSYLTIDPHRAQYLQQKRDDYFSYFNSGILITDAHNDTVYFHNHIGVNPRYIFDIGKSAVPKGLYQQKYANIADFQINHLNDQTGKKFGVWGFLESDEHLFFSYLERVVTAEFHNGMNRPTFVHYNKFSGGSHVFYNIVDDIIFCRNPVLYEFTTFYSQPNGLVAFLISAYDFIKMNNIGQEMAQDANDENQDFLAQKYIHHTKLTDNPFVIICKFR